MWASLRGGNAHRNDIVIEHASGYVGINETNPNYNLHVSGDNASGVAIVNNANSIGPALMGAGNNEVASFPSIGCGVAGTGYTYGVYARANRAGLNGQCAILTYLGNVFKDVRINYQSYSGTHYKIQGDGLVSTVMATSAGKKTLVCPESPEAWIEDYGSGTIAEGRCHVELDPLFLDCVTVNEKHPLKVLVTLTSPITNQFYVEKGLTGFELIVVGQGADTVDGTFDYKVVGKWKDHESLRFADYHEPHAIVEAVEPEAETAGPESNM
jgi:hypothetical protein